jgi:hypothetical protein
MFAARPDGTAPIIGAADGRRCLPLGSGKRDDFRAALSTNAVLFERGDYKFVAGEFAEETLWLLGGAGEQNFENLAALTPDESSPRSKRAVITSCATAGRRRIIFC